MTDESLQGLDVYARAAYPVELSRGRHLMNSSKRVPLLADVDPQTGVVTFRVELNRLNDLRQ